MIGFCFDTTMFRTRELLDAIDTSGHARMQKEFWRARLLDPDQMFFDKFSQPPQELYKYIPAHRLDHVLPDEKPCSFRATPPNELNDINEVNFMTTFADNESNREKNQSRVRFDPDRITPNVANFYQRCGELSPEKPSWVWGQTDRGSVIETIRSHGIFD